MVEAQMNINLFDAFVYFVLFVTGAISFYRGFIKEFISLVTWVGGAFITFSLAPKSTAFMSQYIQSATGAAIIGVLGTYFVVVITLGIFGKIVLRYIKKGADVGWFDNALGLMLGLVKGSILVVLGFILITIVYKDEQSYPDWLRTASTMPTIQTAALQMVRILPESVNVNSVLEAPTAEEMAIQQGEIPPYTPQAVDTQLQQEYIPPQAPPVNNEGVAPQNNSLEQLILDATKE
jgi:membrane protein required for colicin V production